MSSKVWTVIFLSTLQLRATDVDFSGNEYLVKVQEEFLDEIKHGSSKFGLVYKEKVIPGIFVFKDIQPVTDVNQRVLNFIEAYNGKVVAIEERKYSKVIFSPPVHPELPYSLKMFRVYSDNKKCWPYYDMGIQNVWLKHNITGLGVKVAVVDNGVNDQHPDLTDSVDLNLARSFVLDAFGNTTMPEILYGYRDLTDFYTSHGTRAAGLIAAKFQNEFCSAGVAYNAHIVPLKVFTAGEDGPSVVNEWILNGFPYSDEFVAPALAWKRDVIDIYSCSFNLYLKFVPLPLDSKTALEDGAEKGRHGKGNVFVFSSGNGGANGPIHDCNIESFASNVYTLTISSVGKNGTVPSYAISCASTLASAYGDFSTHDGKKRLETTSHYQSCTTFQGTSASAALASGVIALILQARPDLTWRCVQHIFVLSSSFSILKSTERLQINAAAYRYDHKFGFGLMNATAMLDFAIRWTVVPAQRHIVISECNTQQRYVSNNVTAAYLPFGKCKEDDYCVQYVEHVLVAMTFQTDDEDQIDIILCSPSKTCSSILSKNGTRRKRRKRRDKKLKQWRKWTFKSVHFWGESPNGTWTLTLIGSKRSVTNPDPQLESVFLTIYGTATYPYTSEIKLNTTGKLMKRLDEISNKDQTYDNLIAEVLDNASKTDARKLAATCHQPNKENATKTTDEITHTHGTHSSKFDIGLYLKDGLFLFLVVCISLLGIALFLLRIYSMYQFWNRYNRIG